MAGNAPLRLSVPSSINMYLRDYQRDGVAFFFRQYAQNQGGILGDDMVLPPTISVTLKEDTLLFLLPITHAWTHAYSLQQLPKHTLVTSSKYASTSYTQHSCKQTHAHTANAHASFLAHLSASEQRGACFMAQTESLSAVTADNVTAFS